MLQAGDDRSANRHATSGETLLQTCRQVVRVPQRLDQPLGRGSSAFGTTLRFLEPRLERARVEELHRLVLEIVRVVLRDLEQGIVFGQTLEDVIGRLVLRLDRLDRGFLDAVLVSRLLSVEHLDDAVDVGVVTLLEVVEDLALDAAILQGVNQRVHRDLTGLGVRLHVTDELLERTVGEKDFTFLGELIDELRVELAVRIILHEVLHQRGDLILLCAKSRSGVLAFFFFFLSLSPLP
jgi:hypothetical protein